MKAGRGDVSAVLLIAFMFQLLTPIVVLAGETSGDSEFQASLRHSICRVEIEVETDSAQRQAHTDGFVCDWCVLCSVGSISYLERLPDVHFQTSSLAKSSLAYGTSVRSLSLANRDNTSAPRGPPAQGVKNQTDDAILIFATLKEFPSVIDFEKRSLSL